MSRVTALSRRTTAMLKTLQIKKAPPNYAIIFYDPDKHDRDWIEAEKARVIAAGAGYIKTILLMPQKKTDERYTS